MGTSAASGRYRLEWNGSILELATRRSGLRTEVVLFRDGHRVAEGTGAVRVLIPMPDQAEQAADDPERRSPAVLALGVLPGTVSRAFLLVPKPTSANGSTENNGHGGSEPPSPGSDKPGASAAVDEVLADLPKGVAELAGFARAERHLFDPPRGTLAARLLALQRKHPKLYASRHVALAIGKVALGLLGVALFFQVILRHVVNWISERLPNIDWPDIPWPNIDLPSIPWPDIDWPEFALPSWLLAVVASAKYWGPILIAIGLAVKEVRRRTGKRSAASAPSAPPHAEVDPASPDASPPGEDSRHDAHR